MTSHSDNEWILDQSKFLTKDEVGMLKTALKKRSVIGMSGGKKSYVRDWLIIDLALSTGLRVQEISDLNCGDCFIDDEQASLIVRKGKCGKMRMVRFDKEFRAHLKEYHGWKLTANENWAQDAPLLVSDLTGSRLSKRALQESFKRCLRTTGINSTHSIHDCRHTYASFLYKASSYNIRLVQKQLGHSSIRTTEVYADVLSPDLNIALDKLYK